VIFVKNYAVIFPLNYTAKLSSRCNVRDILLKNFVCLRARARAGARVCVRAYACLWMWDSGCVV